MNEFFFENPRGALSFLKSSEQNSKNQGVSRRGCLEVKRDTPYTLLLNIKKSEGPRAKWSTRYTPLTREVKPRGNKF